jgi:hypothetical protein
MHIKSIPTKYRGYHFRSRLEARWAVFFDTAKIRWEYEPEGFDVNGTWYLPDFYLADLHCYFEVKGTSEYDLDLLKRFAQLIKKDLVVAEGAIPDPEEYDCGDEIGLQVIGASPSGDWDMAWGYKDMFLRCTNCGRIEIMNEVYSTMKENCRCSESHARWIPLSEALEAARSARFEYGEKPYVG